jgi:AraC-like DNA-binding protein
MRSCQPLDSSPAALEVLPDREPHVSANFARLVLEITQSRALDTSAVFPADLVPRNDSNARIPASSLFNLLDVAGRLLADDNIGLHAGQLANAARLGLFGLLQQTAASPRALVPVIRRFSRLVHDQSVFDLRERGSQAVFTYRCEDEQRQSIELVVTSLAVCARQIWPGAPLEAVYFAHAAPSGAEEHAQFFGTQVHFGAPFNGYAISSAHLDVPAIGADQGLHAALTEHAERVLDSIDFVAAVRHAVGRGLMLGRSGAPWVASELGISSRTLHRRLQEKAARFSSIVDDERSRRARTQLAAHERVAEVAQRLGFASPGAFRKAFKRWTGLTPAEFKRRA